MYTAMFALAGALIGATATFMGVQWAARSAFDAAMVQIGVGILSADPSKSDVVPARQWAIDLVERHSGHEFNAEDRASLLHHPIQTFQALPFVPGSPFSGVPCSAFRKNPDGSWTILKVEKPGFSIENSTIGGGGFEGRLLDQYCGSH